MIVTTVLDTPYTMLRESSQSNLTGSDRYEGYAVDLVDAISKMLGNTSRLNVTDLLFVKNQFTEFNYVLNINGAGTYGSLDKAGKWNGLIGDLIAGRTHVAVGAISITAARYFINRNGMLINAQ